MIPDIDRFSLLGGPLHRIGMRIGLVDGLSDSRRLGFAIAGVLWGVVLILAFFEGNLRDILSLDFVGGHVRLLIAIPLMFACEASLDPHVRRFLHTLVNSQIVRGEDLERLARELAWIKRMRDSWLVEIVLLVLAATFFAVAAEVDLPGATAAYSGTLLRDEMALAGAWYWFVCLTAVRFLLLRWMWRLGLWWYLLWRLSRLDLDLIPTHPDGVAGLGYLAVAQGRFVLLVFAISAVIAAGFAEEFANSNVTMIQVYAPIALILVIDALLFVAPLFMFASKLKDCRSAGRADYMDFAARYVREFDAKWLRGAATQSESVLGTADLQSLADLTNSVRVVDGMQIAPVSTFMLLQFTLAAVLPFSLLLFFVYPVDEIAQWLVKMLLGL
jgi:hypothetical protein